MNNYWLHFLKQSTISLSTITLFLSGITEILLGLLQLSGIQKSHHNGYPFTGSFYNPGPYACYLAVLLPIAVFAFRNTEYKLLSRMARWLGTGIALACIILIPASLSRTAMIAAAVGTVLAYWDELKVSLAKYRPSYVFRILLAVLSIAVGLYAVKKDSADGRMVMWKIAMQAAAEVPLNGVGWDNVAGAYGEMQERYFELGYGTEEEKMVADAPEYVFNEYLQIAIAFGPLAAIGMIAVLAGALVVSFRKRNYGIAGSVAAIVLVMTASYPLQFPLFTITITLILLAAWLSSSHILVSLTGSAVTVLACAFLFTHYSKTDVQNGFGCGLSLHRSHDYRKSNTILIPLIMKSSDPMILNIIGKNYQALAMPDSAEYYFKKSTFRCPNRVYPHYLLMKLYADSASFDPSKCLNEANTLLTMPVKIPSPAIDEMQQEAKSMINKLLK